VLLIPLLHQSALEWQALQSRAQTPLRPLLRESGLI
jgi:hypothetical protein